MGRGLEVRRGPLGDSSSLAESCRSSICSSDGTFGMPASAKFKASIVDGTYSDSSVNNHQRAIMPTRCPREMQAYMTDLLLASLQNQAKH